MTHREKVSLTFKIVHKTQISMSG